MHQSNFLPRYTDNNSSNYPEEEEEEDERGKLGQSPSESELISTSVVAGDHNSVSQRTPEQTATSQSGEVRGWILQLLYNLIYETSKIVYFIMKVNFTTASSLS